MISMEMTDVVTDAMLCASENCQYQSSISFGPEPFNFVFGLVQVK